MTDASTAGADTSEEGTGQPFVGEDRRQLIDAVKSQLRNTEDDVFVHVAEGVAGIGKSTLRIKLREEARSERSWIVVDFSMSDYVPSKPPRDDDGSNELLAASFECYVRLLGDFAEQLPGKNDGFKRQLKERKQAIVNAEAKIRNDLRFGFGNRVDKLTVVVPPEQYAPQLGEARTREIGEKRQDLEDLAVELVEQVVGRQHPLLVLIDDVERVADGYLSVWLKSLCARLRNSLVVLTRPSSGDAADQGARVWPLENFSLEEVDSYLQQLPALRKPPEWLPTEVRRFSGGHPQAVGIAADWLEPRINDLDEASTQRLLKSLSGNLPDRMNKLVNLIIDDVKEPELAVVLRRAWVLRRFDAESLRRICSDDQQDDTGKDELFYVKMLEKLRHYSFVETHRALPDGPPTYYTFHEFLRENRDAYLATDPKPYEELHQRAADYYVERLCEMDDELKASEPYLGWYRYEKPEWRELQLEWLYHAARLRKNRDGVRIDFALLFLEAFWWWGLYLRFPFCEEILDEWSVTQGVEDKRWGSALRRFNDAYPARWPWSKTLSWQTVEESMVTVRELARLEEEEPRAMTNRRRQVRGLTAVFLAQAIRGQGGRTDEARSSYEEAIRLFTINKDRWNIGWVQYELADLDASIGKEESALNLCARALRLAKARDINDPELTANVHRCLADMALRRRDLTDAFRLYGLAVFQAYRFHVHPHEPDDYTLHFHLDILGQAARQLVDAWQNGDRDEALAGCRRIQDLFAPYWADLHIPLPDRIQQALESGMAGDVADCIAPPPPNEADLGLDDTEYFFRARRVVRSIMRNLEKPGRADTPVHMTGAAAG